MQRIGDEYTIQDPNGNAANAATISIYTAGTTNLATVYAATGAATPTAAAANPITTDGYGRWRVAVPDGRYDIQVSGSNFPTWTIPNICVFDNTITYPSPALGTVTSVQLAAPAEFTTSGGPVTGTGTLTLGYGSWAASKVIIAPTVGGTPTLRNLVLADLPAFGPTASTTFGSVTVTPILTTDSGGRITSIGSTTIAPTWTSIASKPTTVSTFGITNGVECIFTQTASQTFSNTTAETTLLTTGVGSTTIAGGRLVAGSTIRVRLMGSVSITSAVVFDLRLKLGSTTLLTASATYSGSSLVTQTFMIDAMYTVRTTGAGGTGIGQLSFVGYYASGSLDYVFPGAAFTATSSIDTTATQAVDILAKFGTAAANNGFTVTNAQIFIEG